MLSKLSAFIRQYKMLNPGDAVICAVSGGADSVALLFALYLLQEKLEFTLSAAHFNHGLRGEESDRDQKFVEQLCAGYGIPLHIGNAQITAGEKGLEAAAREARYRYFSGLPGKIATAHTADDNAETVLMHLVRGTGLKGLGGIPPVRGNLIRPMLTVTRQEVLSFLAEYHLSCVHDSTNDTDTFFRNRIRHQVMPLLRQENPRLCENVSAMALRLREDEQILSQLAAGETPDVPTLKNMPDALRRRHLALFLQRCGVKEPESAHIALVEQLVFSDKPSARAMFSGGIHIRRDYDRLALCQPDQKINVCILPCPGTVDLPEQSIRITCRQAEKPLLTHDKFTVYARGNVVVRCRETGDTLRLSGGSKSLKELFIDRKIPAAVRNRIPVVADEAGVLGVWGIGANLDRVSGAGNWIEIEFEKKKD